MRYCGNCGTQDTIGSAYCGACGSPFQSAGQPVGPQPQARPSGPRPGYEYGAPQLPSIDWRKIVVGNWLGAAITAAAILGTAGVLSTTLGLLAKPDNFGIDNTLTLIATILGGTFGADLVGSATSSGDTVHAHLGVFPLTVSVITAAVGVVVFRRVTARYPRPGAALGDAARTALLVALPLLVFALIFRSDTKELGSGWAADLADLQGTEADFGSSVAGCLFLGFLTVFCTLGLSVFLRRDWWGPRVRKAHDWIAAPLYGGATMLALLPLAGLVGIGLLLLFGESNTEEINDVDDAMAAIALLFGFAANGGMWLMSLGSGAAYGTSGEYSGGGDSGSDGELHHLKFFTQDEPGLWAAPAVMLLVVFVSAFVVARRSAHPSLILGNLLRWVGLLFVIVPFLLRLTTVHAGFSGSSAGDGDYRASGLLGPDGLQTTFFLVGAALLCALLVAALSRAIDVDRIRSQLAAAGARIQSNPAPPVAPPGADPQQPYPTQAYPQQPYPPQAYPQQPYPPQAYPPQAYPPQPSPESPTRPMPLDRPPNPPTNEGPRDVLDSDPGAMPPQT